MSRRRSPALLPVLSELKALVSDVEAMGEAADAASKDALPRFLTRPTAMEGWIVGRLRAKAGERVEQGVPAGRSPAEIEGNGQAGALYRYYRFCDGPVMTTRQLTKTEQAEVVVDALRVLSMSGGVKIHRRNGLREYELLRYQAVYDPMRFVA